MPEKNPVWTFDVGLLWLISYIVDVALAVAVVVVSNAIISTSFLFVS